MAARKSKIQQVILPDGIDIDVLMGEDGRFLKQVAGKTETQIKVAGTVINIQGQDYKKKSQAKNVIERLIELVRAGSQITDEIVGDQIAEQAAEKSRALTQPFNGASLALKAKEISPRGESQRRYLQGIMDHRVTFAVGEAGTGKTFLAVAAAIHAYESGEVDKIILCRPAVEAGERLGFLPGTEKEKVDPYFRPIYDALAEMLPRYKALVDSGAIEIAPLAFMRGRTLKNAFVILDEAQNTTRVQMKMFLTRLGENSKMVITGDHTQIDLPGGYESSGLVQAVRAMENEPGIYLHKFTSADVVRDEMVGRMLHAYERLEQKDREAPAPARIQGP